MYIYIYIYIYIHTLIHVSMYTFVFISEFSHQISSVDQAWGDQFSSMDRQRCMSFRRELSIRPILCIRLGAIRSAQWIDRNALQASFVNKITLVDRQKSVHVKNCRVDQISWVDQASGPGPELQFSREFSIRSALWIGLGATTSVRLIGRSTIQQEILDQINSVDQAWGHETSSMELQKCSLVGSDQLNGSSEVQSIQELSSGSD